MAIFSMTNAAIFIGTVDATGDTNSLDVNLSTNALPATTFGSGGQEVFFPGLTNIVADYEGLLNVGSGNTEELLSMNNTTSNVGILGQSASYPVTWSQTGAADGDTAYFIDPIETQFDQPYKVGDMATFKGHMVNGAATCVRGKIMLPKGAQTTSGTGTVQTLGAVSSTQKVYAGLHVFAASGSSSPTLVVKVRSAVTSFATITDRITFSTISSPTLGSQFASTAGAITDTFWRVDYTITGSSPSFTFAVAVGIQ